MRLDRNGRLGFSLTGVILTLLMGFKPGLVALSTLASVYLTLNVADHTFGYKSLKSDATNLKRLALITFGEGLYNNHHARPASPKLSAFEGEIDPAWPVIRLMEKLRLVETPAPRAVYKSSGHFLVVKTAGRTAPTSCHYTSIA